MANEIAKLFVTIGSDISGFQKGWNTVQGRLKGIGAGMTAAGAAGLKLIDSAREINAQLATTAITVGSTTKELRGMVMETANVTFGIDSVTKTFDLLARAGVRNQEDLKASANAFDALGDATFSSAETVADILIPAFKVFGLELPKTANELDKFTWLTKNTTIDLEEFGSVMSYVAMYGADLGLAVEDLIAILAALEDRGIGGAEATRLFRTAVKQAADGVAPFNEILGVSQEQIAGYKQEMAGAIGITEQYADAANTQYGVMDKLKFQWSKIQLAIGSALTPLEPMFALMTALGPAMIFLGSSAGKSALAFIAHAAAVVRSNIATAAHTISARGLAVSQGIAAGAAGSAASAQTFLAAATSAGIAPTVSLKIAQDALNTSMRAFPLWAIIAAITAAVFAIKYLWENWERISINMDKTWLKMRNTLAGGLPTYQAEMDLLNLEMAWQDLAKTVKTSQEQIVSDVKMATDRMISSAETAANEEKRILDERLAFFREKHYEKLELIDEEMLAELRAIDPVAAARVETINSEIGALNDRKKAREEEEEKDRITALRKELRDSNTSKERKKAIRRELNELEDTRERERLIEERNLAISQTDYENYYEGKKTIIDQQLADQIDIYKQDLLAFKELNHDKLAVLRVYVDEYNRILAEAGLSSNVEMNVPEGAAPEQRVFPGQTGWMWGGISKYASGGIIAEPTLLYGLTSRRPYAIAGESGIEHVSPGGTGDTFNFQVVINNPVVRKDQDIQDISRKVMIEAERMYTRRARGRGL